MNARSLLQGLWENGRIRMLEEQKMNLITDSNVEVNKGRLKNIDLNCLVCRRTLEYPRVLDCLHSFCEECIANNAIKSDDEPQENPVTSSVKCLKCGEITEIPDSDLSLLPYNFLANNAIDLLLISCEKDAKVLCRSCDDNSDALARCIECSEFLCMSCVGAHRRLRVTKEHKIVTLDTLRHYKTNVHRPVVCPDHSPEVFLYYCEVCKDLICKECTILTHRGHRYERIKEALEERKPFLMRLLESNENFKIPPIEKAVDEVQDMAARLHARTVATKQAVKNCAAECIQKIERRCQDFLQSVDEIYKRKSRILHDQLTELQARLVKNRSACDFVDYAFKHGSEAEIFELYDIMKSRLETLNAENFDYKEPHDNDIIEHVCNPTLIERIADNLGQISTTQVFLSNTVAYGQGLHTAKVGVEAFFHIAVYNRFLKRCVEENHDEGIKVKIQAPENFYINNRITNNRDGTFTCRFVPVTKGNHEILIKIRGRGFPNNRYICKVHDGIDYAKVHSVFLTIGQNGSKSGEFRQPWATTVNQNGHLYVTDHVNNRVQVFDKLGNFIREFGSRGSKDGQFLGPTGIAIDSTGVVFVADWENHRIQVFTQNGTFIRTIGKKGSEEGQLIHPAGLAIDRSGYVVVADMGNNRLQVFTVDGSSVLCIGAKGSGQGQLDSPTHIAVKQNNSYIVSDSGNNRLVCFDNGGLYMEHVGCKGIGPGEFVRPAGVVVDHEGYVIVADFHNHRVQVLSPELRHFATFGKEGCSPGEFKYPSGVALTHDGRLAIVDRFNHRVQIF